MICGDGASGSQGKTKIADGRPYLAPFKKDVGIVLVENEFAFLRVLRDILADTVHGDIGKLHPASLDEIFADAAILSTVALGIMNAFSRSVWQSDDA